MITARAVAAKTEAKSLYYQRERTSAMAQKELVESARKRKAAEAKVVAGAPGARPSTRAWGGRGRAALPTRRRGDGARRRACRAF